MPYAGWANGQRHRVDQRGIDPVELVGQLFCAALRAKHLRQCFGQGGEAGHVRKQDRTMRAVWQPFGPGQGMQTVDGNIMLKKTHSLLLACHHDHTHAGKERSRILSVLQGIAPAIHFFGGKLVRLERIFF